MKLEETINKLFELSIEELVVDKEVETIYSFIDQLDKGLIRCVEKTEEGYKTNEWVKKGILLGFRVGSTREMSIGELNFFDKHTYPLKEMSEEQNVRIVPGGSSVRKGAYLEPGAVIMPPSYVNVGAYVSEGTMLDSHVLVGSCAYIGKNCHLSTGVQIGGVLEPINATPCIVEDNVFLGINSAIAEGTTIKEGAVLAPGVIISAGTPIYDIPNEEIIYGVEGKGPIVPAGAMVVMGCRSSSKSLDNDFARDNQLGLYTPIIIKYRDEKTNRSLELEKSLRG